MDYQVTVRYGRTHVRYHTMDVSGDDFRDALEAVAESLPDEIAKEADLLEMRPASDPEDREYLEGDPYDS
jgi:hypothetical protein